MRLLFVAIAGAEIGYGHLSRCLSLANYARRQEIESSFLILGDAGVLRQIEHAGYPGIVQPCSALAEQAAGIMQGRIEAFDAVVVDFSHPVIFRDIGGGRKLLNSLRHQARTLMVIDALGEQALAPRMPDMPADIYVAPYVGAVAVIGAPWRTLAGPEYAVLAPVYAGLLQRIVREQADRVLVSCGGADPRQLTLLVLDGIEQIRSVLTLRVVVGPLFSRELADALAACAAGSHHVIELIHEPTGLAEHMLWSDLAVAASGLIKYELAAASTPAILFSIDRSHDVVNRPFLEMGTARDLGVEFSAGEVAEEIAVLLEDRAVRAGMAAAGRRLVDGKGAERLINDIMRSCCVVE